MKLQMDRRKGEWKRKRDRCVGLARTGPVTHRKHAGLFYPEYTYCFKCIL